MGPPTVGIDCANFKSFFGAEETCHLNDQPKEVAKKQSSVGALGGTPHLVTG